MSFDITAQAGDLKSADAIMSIIADPAKAQKALADIKVAHQEAVDATAALAALWTAQDTREASLNAREAALNDREAALKAREVNAAVTEGKVARLDKIRAEIKALDG